MIADGLWIDRRHRLASPHQPRQRRDCLGELVQRELVSNGAKPLNDFVTNASATVNHAGQQANQAAITAGKTTEHNVDSTGRQINNKAIEGGRAIEQGPQNLEKALGIGR